mmetsp:Transcript_16644/g.38516  ORF Transcript_16644/g.38516 Transcript_16644/m.38516 type:complete len:83 (-) Transcript_16644:119-367(-)
MRELFEKLIRMTANTFVELEEEQKMDAMENSDSKARYNIVVNFTEKGFKLTNLERARGDNDEGDAVSPPAKKAKCDIQMRVR